MSTLSSVVQELQISNKLSTLAGEDQSNLLYDIVQELGRLNYTLNAMFDEAKKNALLASRETPSVTPPEEETKPPQKEKEDLVVDDPGKFAGMIMGATAGLVTGIIAGATAGVVALLAKLMPARVKALGANLVTSLKSYFGAIKNTIKGVAQQMGKSIAAIGPKFMASIKDTKLGQYIDDIGKYFKSVKDAFAPLGRAIAGSGKGLFTPLKLITGIISDIVGFAGKFFQIFFSIGRSIGRLFVPLAVVMTVWDTVMGAVDGFTKDGGNLFSKIVAAMAGALKGLGKLITIPMDLLKSAISWLAGKMGFDQVEETLDSFSFTELFAKIVDGLEDLFRGLVDGIFSFFGGSDFFGKADLKPLSEEDLQELTPQEQAEKSGLYNKKGIARDSTINEEGLANATPEQLQAIIDDGDLDDDAMGLVKATLAQKTSSGDDQMLAAIKTISPEMTPDEAAQAEVNAAASKKKRDAHLASVPPEKLAAIRAEMGLGTSDVEVVETDQHKLNQFAAQQSESHRRINEKYAAPAKAKGTVADAIKRDPVTGMPLAGSFKAPAGSEGSVFTVLDPVSGEVQTFDDFERASMFAAANEMDVKTVPKASVSGGGNNLQASQQMSSGTTKMNDGNAQLAQGNSGGNVAVNAPTTTTNIQNSTHRGAMPTSMDKSDRTDRRGRNRGTG